MKAKTKKKRDDFLKLLKKEKFPGGIIEAVAAVRQELFFESAFQEKFYSLEDVPIGAGEFSDLPLDMLRMIHRLGPNKKWRLLEVGTGSGYSTAVLSQLVKEVVTIEWIESLAAAAKKNLRGCGADNVRIFCGDGTVYDRTLGQFDAVIIFSACRKRPLSLTRQLKQRGKIAFPMGTPSQQQIVVMSNESPESLDDDEDLFKTRFHEFCIFPPVRGRYGWDQVMPSSFSE